MPGINEGLPLKIIQTSKEYQGNVFFFLKKPYVHKFKLSDEMDKFLERHKLPKFI